MDILLLLLINMGRESEHFRGVKALAIELGLKSKENQMIMACNL
jgi:hypothetical protein